MSTDHLTLTNKGADYEDAHLDITRTVKYIRSHDRAVFRKGIGAVAGIAVFLQTDHSL